MPETGLPLCVRINIGDKRSADNLEKDGWRLIEVLETFQRESMEITSRGVSSGVTADKEPCMEIARETGGGSRLYKDTLVSDKLAESERLKIVWNAKDILVSDGGFLIPKYSGDRAWIDMIAVAPEKQGQGIGQQLVRQFMNWAYDSGCGYITAGTQKDNFAARMLYQNCGFAVCSAEKTFHK